MHKKQGFYNHQHCIVCAPVSCVHVACLIKSHQVSCPSFAIAVCLLLFLLFRKHRSGCVGVGEGQRGKLGVTRGGSILGFLAPR